MATTTRTTVCVLLILAFVVTVSAGDLEWVTTGRRLGDNAELELGVPRRFLDESDQYIGYGALDKDRTPCALPGASYYNCRPGAEANPYDRGCSAIAGCRDVGN